MKDMGIVYGSAAQAVPLIIGKDKVYVHTDIREHTVTDPDTGETRTDYTYHEVQYELREFLQIKAGQLVLVNSSMAALIGDRSAPDTEQMGLKLQAFLDSAELPPKPELPPKIGYMWKPIYNQEGHAFSWEAVPDPNAQGTQDNPIPWKSGMAVIVNAWYIYEGETYVCICDGNPTDINDKNYFEQMD